LAVKTDMVVALNQGIAISFAPIKDGTIVVMTIDPSDGSSEQEVVGPTWNGNDLDAAVSRILSRLPFEKPKHVGG
jgi:hypothetical protein